MTQPDSAVSVLRNILENLQTPDVLDQHPWAQKLFVQEACRHDSTLASLPPGRQLIGAILQVFRKLQPATPPKRGVRLDTRWGEFGLLAAQYFAPYVFGLPVPVSLRDAWRGIDRAILLFVFDGKDDTSPEERERYQLISAEPEIAPHSTVSDWHRKGLERLAESVIQYERHLESAPVVNQPPAHALAPQKQRGFAPAIKQILLWSARLGLLLGVLLVVLGAWKGWQIYQKLQAIQERARIIQSFSPSKLDLTQIKAAGQQVALLRAELADLQGDVAPLLPFASYFDWVPTYGGDLSQSANLLEMGVQLSIAGDEVFQSLAPALQTSSSATKTSQILSLLSSLKDADSNLLVAQVALSRARNLRQQIKAERLSENVRKLLTGKIDPLFLALEGAFPVDDLFSMARLAPRLLGAVGNGAQTYMILIQNEDEIRPTGGFLTAVGTMTVKDGEMAHLAFESSDLVDDLTKPYPKAPWQLDQYMKAEIFLFRDANWFTNFPTTVEWTKFLYAYTHPTPINGVIAMDQHVLVELLQAVGPINVEGIDQPVTAQNVLGLMRVSKQQTPPPGVSAEDWDRKQFIGRLAAGLTPKILGGGRDTWQPLIRAVIRLLDEKHLLLQFDDPEMKNLLGRRGWDGALRPPENSDFLMAVDSNIGFNKTSLMMQTDLTYRLNLTDLIHPTGELTVAQTNKVELQKQGDVDCIQGQRLPEAVSEMDYPIRDCYWSYLRIYTPAGSELLTSTPHAIPALWPLREQAIPAQTDTLDEGIPGIQAFGTLVVIPPHQTLETSFSYALPSAILKYDSQDHTWMYRLAVQKQPGTLANSLVFSFELPVGAEIVTTSSKMTKQGNTWVLNADLRQDLLLEIVFRVH